MRTHAHKLFVFGKIPGYSDFISFGLESLAWVQIVLEDFTLQCMDDHPDPWYDSRILPRFIFFRRNDLFRGLKHARLAVVDSCDRHQRRFPVFVGLAAHGKVTEISDIAMEHFRSSLVAWNAGNLDSALQILRTTPIQAPPTSAHSNWKKNSLGRCQILWQSL